MHVYPVAYPYNSSEEKSAFEMIVLVTEATACILSICIMSYKICLLVYGRLICLLNEIACLCHIYQVSFVAVSLKPYISYTHFVNTCSPLPLFCCLLTQPTPKITQTVKEESSAWNIGHVHQQLDFSKGQLSVISLSAVSTVFRINSHLVWQFLRVGRHFGSQSALVFREILICRVSVGCLALVRHVSAPSAFSAWLHCSLMTLFNDGSSLQLSVGQPVNSLWGRGSRIGSLFLHLLHPSVFPQTPMQHNPHSYRLCFLTRRRHPVTTG